MSDKAGIRRLVLSEYRSYAALDLSVGADMVVVSGENGSGKTNLIEAVSMFSQGRGLRRADLGECAQRPGSGGFAVSIELATKSGLVRYGTGLGPGEGGGMIRRHRVDREPVSSARAFADQLRLVWLTPMMDGLFTGSPGERRRFLDRLVLAVDAEHGTRVLGLERVLRQRNRLLEEGSRADGAWLDALEREIAELAVAVAAARTETIGRLAAFAQPNEGAFPWAEARLSGEVEALCLNGTAIAAEDTYRAMLKDQRRQDAAAGRTLVGPHVSDLEVRHGPKAIDAGLCSTGEQKALLVSLVLAHARLVADVSGLAPILLLDEIAAHFDERRREALFAALAQLDGQVWMTGADAGVFSGLRDAQHLRVEPGKVIEADKAFAG